MVTDGGDPWSPCHDAGSVRDGRVPGGADRLQVLDSRTVSRSAARRAAQPEGPMMILVEGRQSSAVFWMWTFPVPNWFLSKMGFFVGVGLTV